MTKKSFIMKDSRFLLVIAVICTVFFCTTGPAPSKLSAAQKISSEVKWYEYEPQEVTLNGKLMEATAFGPTNYGENPKTDRIEEYYYMTLDVPINVKGDGKVPCTTNVETEQNVREVQLVIHWMSKKDILAEAPKGQKPTGMPVDEW